MTDPETRRYYWAHGVSQTGVGGSHVLTAPTEIELQDKIDATLIQHPTMYIDARGTDTYEVDDDD